MTSRRFIGSMNVEEDILYQWRLRRRLEEARREAKSKGIRTQVHTTTLDTGMKTRVPGMGTGPDRTGIRMGSIAARCENAGMGITGADGAGMGITAGIGTGLGVGKIKPMLALYQLAGAAATEHEGREKDIGALTDLGVVYSNSSSSWKEHGGVKSPSSSSSTTSSSGSGSNPRVSEKDEVVETDCNSHSSNAKEEQHTTNNQRQQILKT